MLIMSASTIACVSEIACVSNVMTASTTGCASHVASACVGSVITYATKRYIVTQ